MSKHIFNSVRKTYLEIKTSNDTWVFTDKSSITATNQEFALVVDKGYDGNTLDLSGAVTSIGDKAVGLLLYGDNDTATIEATGKVTSDYGVITNSTGTVITNLGTVKSGTVGIYSLATNASLTNSGSVTASDGDGMWLADGRLVNTASGKVSATDDGVHLTNMGDKLVVNHGTISGQRGIYNDEGGHVVVKNFGTIDGGVWLGSGTASIDTRHGTIHGGIHGSAGDTTYMIANAKLAISEDANAGTDTVKSTVGYTLGANIENLVLLGKADIDATGNTLDNHLTGNAGNNVISGGAGLDFLDGGKGNDTLTGGADQDNFVFDKGNGVDTITDFTHGSDYVDILKFSAFQDYESLASHISQHNKDTWIDLGGGDKIILHHITASALTADDFVFG